ncbi:MAG: hypothetical protein IIC07_01515 [Proteobacteria bacterium]|nr:hypothetical protein [Pseudomonadota bacterium]
MRGPGCKNLSRECLCCFPVGRGKRSYALAALIGQGDAIAFQVLMERHINMHLSFAERMMGNREEAEDIRELQIKIQIPMHEILIEAAIDLDTESRRKLLFLGDGFDGRGLWSSRKFDGARWRVRFENGEIILDLEGITDGNEEENR